jgi:glycosyltransferase involved in cell wall biosynthesis
LRDAWWSGRVQVVASLPFLPYDYYRVGLPYFQGIDQALNRFSPDLVHAVSPTFLGMYALGYARRRGIPAVSSYHTRFVSYFPYYGLGGLERFGWGFLRWFYNQFAATYAPSETAARELADHGVASVELWERGIDTARFSPRFRDPALRQRIGADRGPIVLYVGRLVREKDLADLADAATLLRERHQPARFVLVGDGPMRAELERRLPDAHFAGHQAGADLARWYASADFFLFPSTTETFGNVVLEAFASGLPTVGAAAGGVQDLVQPGVNGLLATPRDPRDLADKIEILLRNPSYAARLRRGALETAERYRWPAVNGRLLDSYARTVADQQRAA